MFVELEPVSRNYVFSHTVTMRHMSPRDSVFLISLSKIWMYLSFHIAIPNCVVFAFHCMIWRYVDLKVRIKIILILPVNSDTDKNSIVHKSYNKSFQSYPNCASFSIMDLQVSTMISNFLTCNYFKFQSN